MGRPRRNLKSSSPIVKAEDEDDDDYELIWTSSVGGVQTEEADSDSDYDFERDVSSSKKNLKGKEKAKSKNGTGDAAARKTQRSTTTYSTSEEQRKRQKELYIARKLAETPEEKEERNRKNRIYRQQRIEGFSSEERKEFRRKVKERKQRQFAKMTPEELEQRKAKINERMKEKLAEMTPEERQERSNRLKENRKKLKVEDPIKYEEQRRKQSESQKKWYLNPQKQEQQRLYQRIRTHKINSEMNPEALAEIRKRQNFQSFIWRSTRTEEEKQNMRMKKIIYRTTKLASMTDEELKDMRKRNRERVLENEKRMSAEQKERNRINQNKSSLAWMKRNAAKVNAYNREYQRRQTEKETPEKRHKRLLRYKIYQGKRKLKQQLELDGVSPEEIQKQLDELTERLQRENPPPPPQDSSTTATGTMSVYKPRFKEKTTACNKDRRPQDPATIQRVQLAPHVINYYGYDNNDTKSNDSDRYYAPVSSTPTSESVTPSDSPHMAQENIKITTSAPSAMPPTIPYYGKVEPQRDAIHLASSSRAKNNQESGSRTNAEIPLASEDKPIPKTKTSRFDPNKTWNCPKCQAIVHSHVDLNQHYKTYHFMPKKLKKEKVLEMESIEKKVEIKDIHTFPSEKIEIEIPHKFVCIKCPAASPGSTFETKENLLAHVKRKHRKSFWPCAHCGILKYSSSSHESHFNICMKVNKTVTKVKTYKSKSSSRSKSKTAQKKRSYRKRK